MSAPFLARLVREKWEFLTLLELAAPPFEIFDGRTTNYHLDLFLLDSP